MNPRNEYIEPREFQMVGAANERQSSASISCNRDIHAEMKRDS